MGALVRAAGQASAPDGAISPQLNALLDELTRRALELKVPDRRAAPDGSRSRMPVGPDPTPVLQGQFLGRLAGIRARLGDAQGALKVTDQIALPFFQQEARAQIAEKLDRNGRTNEAARIRATLSDPQVLDRLSGLAGEAAHESVQAGRLDEARGHLARALALAAKSDWPFRRTDILFAFGQALFQTGHTNEALSTLAQAVEMTRPFFDKAEGNVPWVMLRDTAGLQAQMGDRRTALATAELIRDPEQWSSAHLGVQRAQIAQGDMEGARRTFDQLLKATENKPNFSSISALYMSAQELGAGLAKNGRPDEARKLLADARSPLREAAKGQDPELLKRFDLQLPMVVVRGLIEGKHFAEAAKEMSGIQDELERNGLQARLEAARVEAADASAGPATADVSSPGALARTAANARKLAQSGQFAEAFKLAEALPPQDAQSVFGSAVQTAIQSNKLAQAEQALKKFPVAQPKAQWDDGGIGFKVRLLQQLAKAQAERKLTNEARATLREAAALCAKSENQNVWVQVINIVPQLAALGDAEGTLATLAAGRGLLNDVGVSAGEGLARSLGAPAAITIARAQKDKNLELHLLVGVAEEMSRK